ncbi:MAG TPA: SusC/RagA family TonB-linked outer membrane protein, partial [Longimicrobiaceae bacterium]
MKKLFVLLSLALAFWAPEAMAQARTVTGRVTAAETGAPIPGVSVSVPGTSIGTLTDAEGRFTLQVPADATTLSFRALSYGSRDVQITGTELNVTLESQAVALEGVVVTALGLQRQARTLGVAAEQVAGEALAPSVPNIVANLSGKAAGVHITTASTPGGSSRIVIRGENSLLGNNQPLWIVDGIPVDNFSVGRQGTQTDQGGYDYGNAVQDIPPDAIESITILKGPNAAALYGSRAANGAVIVTTKKGQNITGGAEISVSQTVTWEDELRLPDYQNEYGQGFVGAFAYKNGEGGGLFDEVDESWGPPLDQGLMIPQFNSPVTGVDENGEPILQPLPWVSHPDNVDDYFEVGRTMATNVSVAAATDRMHGRFGASRLDQNGMVPGFSLERNALTFAGGLDATDRLNVSSSIQYIEQDGNNRPGVGYDENNPMQQFIWFGRQVDIRDLRRNYDKLRGPDEAQAGRPYSWNYSFHPNPYYLQLVNRNFDSRDRLIGQISVNYEFTDWLSGLVRTSTDWYQDERKKTYAEDNFGGLYTTNPLTAAREEVQPSGAFADWDIGFQEVNTDFLLTANPQLGLPFSTTFTFGGNRRDQSRSHNYVWVSELATPGIFNVSNAAVTPQPYVREFRKRVNSLYGQAEFGYNDYLFLTLTGRNDWSSTLPEQNNSYFYPSVSGSLIFSDVIPALQSSSFLNYGKLRASWARVGNDTDPYQLRNVYLADEVYNGNPSFTVGDEQLNPDLKPEITESVELGTELAFLDNRLGLDLTVYREQTRDQIMPVNISPTTGFESRWLNAGTVENKGIEVLLRGALIETDRFSWESAVTWAKNKSTVKELAEGVDGLEISLGDFWGVSLFARKGEPYGQLMGRKYARNPDGRIIVSDNGLPTRTGAPEVIGNINPDWRGSWANDFTIGGVRIHSLLDTKWGGDIYSVTRMFGLYAGILSETVGRGRCVYEEEIADLAPGTSHYPICDENTGIIVDGVRRVVNGSDTTWVENDIPISGPDFYTYGSYLVHEYNVLDASYMKLRELSVSFDVPERYTDAVGISGMQISLIGRNLWLWTPSENRHIDPETSNEASNVQGFEYGQMPTPRSIG